MMRSAEASAAGRATGPGVWLYGLAWTVFALLASATALWDLPWATATWGAAGVCSLLHPLSPLPIVHRRGMDGRRAPGMVAIGAGAFLGVVLAVAPPVFSDDLWRYLLDGRAGAAGVSPFAYAPASPKVADWVAATGGSINHPHMPTIYPPLAQWLFTAVVAVGGGATAWRLVAWGAVLGASAWFDRSRRSADTPEPLSLLAVVCTHPLCLLAVAGSGHVDAFGLLAMAWFLAAGTSSRATPQRVLAWWVAGGLKMVPALFAVSEGGGSGTDASTTRRILRGTLATVSVLLAFLATWFVIDRDPAGWMGSTPTYVQTWANAGGAARWVEAVLVWLIGEGTFELSWFTWMQQELGRGRPSSDGFDPTSWWDAGEVARWVTRAGLGATLVAVALEGLVRRRVPAQIAERLWWTLLLLTPVFHPWYALWLVPFAVASGTRLSRWLVTAAPLAWWGAARGWDGGGWSDPWWIGLMMWLPAWGLLCASRWQRSSSGQAF
jgi:hypothetical protein